MTKGAGMGLGVGVDVTGVGVGVGVTGVGLGVRTGGVDLGAGVRTTGVAGVTDGGAVTVRVTPGSGLGTDVGLAFALKDGEGADSAQLLPSRKSAKRKAANIRFIQANHSRNMA